MKWAFIPRRPEVGGGGEKKGHDKSKRVCVRVCPCTEWAGFWSVSFSHPDHISVPLTYVLAYTYAAERRPMKPMTFWCQGSDQWECPSSDLSRLQNSSRRTLHAERTTSRGANYHLNPHHVTLQTVKCVLNWQSHCRSPFKWKDLLNISWENRVHSWVLVPLR